LDPYVAARAGDIPALRAYVDAGGDVNIRGRGQLERTPLHVAIEARHSEVTRVLIDLGADVNAQDYRRDRPLHYASGLGLADIVELLLARGADAQAVDVFGDTAVHDVASGGGGASEADQVRIVQHLLAAGADVDAVANCGRSALWYAAAHGKAEVAAALLRAGADPARRALGEQGTPRDVAKGDVARLLSR
jgi:ankyrin repeat protein